MEYSFGRKLFHKCNGKKEFHGKIFESDEKKQDYWNSLDFKEKED